MRLDELHLIRNPKGMDRSNEEKAGQRLKCIRNRIKQQSESSEFHEKQKDLF